MQIEKKVKEVERLFESIDKKTLVFLDKAQINCIPGCTKCCHGKSVMASPLEFLPLAYDFYRRDLLEDRYFNLKNFNLDVCSLVQPGIGIFSGQCGEYEKRGIICRLFGGAAMINKHGEKIFSACGMMKEQISDTDKFQMILHKEAPVFHEFYTRLRNIDNLYGGMRLPINLALLKAMEMVYFSTRGKRKHSA